MAVAPKKDLYRRTLQSLEAVRQVHPDNPKILRQLALAYFKAGQFDANARKLFEQVSELYPSDMRVQRAVAIGCMISQGQELLRDAPSLEDIDPENLGRSINQLNRLCEEYPDSADIHRALGDLQLIRGQYRDALQHYRTALALGSADLDSMCAHFESLSPLFDLPPNVLAFFAEVYQRAERPEMAHRLYTTLVDEGGINEDTLADFYLFLTRRLQHAQHDKRSLDDLHLQICHVTLLLGRTDEAIEWAHRLGPESISSNPELAKKLGRHLIDVEDYRQAFDYLSKIELDNEAKALLNEIAVHLEQRGELDTAVYLLQFINEHDLISQGRSQDDIPKLHKEDHSPDLELEINTELQLAELHWRNRRWKLAFESYLKALEMGYEDYRTILEPLDSLMERIPDVSVDQLAFLANFFAEWRDWRRSLYYAERALFLDPSLDDIRARLSQACEQILLRDPDACEVRLKLGDIQLEKGNIERAMKEYRKAASFPEYGMKANRRMAIALFKTSNLKAAFEKFQELPVLENEDLEHLYDLMISFQTNEQWRLALESATLIKDFDPNFRDVSGKLLFYEKRIAAADKEFTIDPKMRELIGDHAIGRYRYIKKIGSGGMGVVHQVVDLKTNVEVAMKILREGLSSSDKAIDRFFREARIAATLRHRNIVNILDYNISNTYGQSYIAMEYVDGPSLRDILEKKFAQTVEVDLEYVLQVMDWMMQVCDALDATHRKGIIHRDIKPDNIMVARNNVIKLTDFGIVHIEEATFTPTGALIGTPRYMSPEQVHGGRIDARSDIYSVGIIMYEMLAGSPPFISGDISYQQVNVLPTPPREICEMIPGVVDSIVMRCLEKNSQDRFQIAMDLRSALEEAFVHLGGNSERLYPAAEGEAPPPLLADDSDSMATGIGGLDDYQIQTTTETHHASEDDPDNLIDSEFDLDMSEFEIPPAAPNESFSGHDEQTVLSRPKAVAEIDTDFDLSDYESPAPETELDSELDLGTEAPQSLDEDLDLDIGNAGEERTDPVYTRRVSSVEEKPPHPSTNGANNPSTDEKRRI